MSISNSFYCPVDATISKIGGKSKTIILFHLKQSTLRDIPKSGKKFPDKGEKNKEKEYGRIVKEVISNSETATATYLYEY